MGKAANLAAIGSVADTPLMFRNRIMNPGMVIDQRNAGASVTITNTADVTYTLDRWAAYGSASSKFSVQRNAGSITPPSGFSNYLGVTSLAATSLGASDGYWIAQRIEGFNVADLGWGAAGAQSVTLSFWVRSSLTGTFGGSVFNSAANRSYTFSYTISAANSWEQKTVVIPGDTSGTWLTTSGTGIQLNFGLGVGSVFSGTAGAWASAADYTADGAVSVVGTNGATWYITGVQLERGANQNPVFENRPYGVELALCQRYTERRTDLLTIQAGIYTKVFFNTKKRSSTSVTVLSGSGYTGASANSDSAEYVTNANANSNIDALYISEL